jgi:long-chain acyl-CoA synthetase
LVSPGQIESVLDGLPDVTECAVVDAPGADEPVPVAFVVLRQPSTASGERLREHSNRLLNEHQRLHRVDVLDALPRLPNGKLDRAALRARVR